MQRKQTRHPHFPIPRLVFVLLLLAVVLAAASGLSRCAFQPIMATRGTMLFLPGL